MPATFSGFCLFFFNVQETESLGAVLVLFITEALKNKILWEGGSASAQVWGCETQLLAPCPDFRGSSDRAAGSVLGGCGTLLPAWFWLQPFHKMFRILVAHLVLDLDSQPSCQPMQLSWKSPVLLTQIITSHSLCSLGDYTFS